MVVAPPRHLDPALKRALFRSQTKRLHDVPMHRNSSHLQPMPLRVVKGCVRWGKCVCVSVGAKNSCALAHDLTTTNPCRALYCGEEHATKFSRAVRFTCCAQCPH